MAAKGNRMSTSLTIALSFAATLACIAIDCTLVLRKRRAVKRLLQDELAQETP
jgi:hypothetical protein